MIDGPTLVSEALDAGVPLESAFAEPATIGEPHHGLLARLADAGVPVHEVVPNSLARVTDTVTPQGVAAVAPLPAVALDEVAEADVVLVLVSVSDPGNAGTLVRTAEASGVGAVVFCRNSVDPFAPKCVRASAGSLFHVLIASGEDPVEVLERLGDTHRRRIGMAAREGQRYDAVDLMGPAAIVVGSEAHGLPDEVRPLIDEWVHVPMGGRVESLNVAVAGALVLFEAARQRERSSG